MTSINASDDTIKKISQMRHNRGALIKWAYGLIGASNYDNLQPKVLEDVQNIMDNTDTQGPWFSYLLPSRPNL
jgi:hypothetical protein